MQRKVRIVLQLTIGTRFTALPAMTLRARGSLSSMRRSRASSDDWVGVHPMLELRADGVRRLALKISPVADIFPAAGIHFETESNVK